MTLSESLLTFRSVATPDTTARIRKSAEERREEIVAIAIEQFALSGYKGTSTEAIAREAGISQPYLFRLFKTKRDLFLACYDVAHGRILETFRVAARGVPPEEALAAMGHAYVHELLADKTALLFQMQSYAACSDPVIQARVRDCYGALVKEVTRLSGAAARGGLAVLLPRHAAQRGRVARPGGDRRQRAVGAGVVRARRPDREDRAAAVGRSFFRPRAE